MQLNSIQNIQTKQQPQQKKIIIFDELSLMKFACGAHSSNMQPI